MLGKMFEQRIPRARSSRVLSMFASMFLAAAAAAAPPAGGGAGGGSPSASPAGAAPAAATGSGGAPTSPSGFFSQSAINFSKPADGWSNWWSGFPVPDGERTHNYYLCYDIERTSDANVPFVFKNVDVLQSERGVDDPSKRIPCHSTVPSAHARPILRGDRLRVAVDMSSEAAQAFFQNVSLVDVNVVLTVAPPIQITLLRTNLGGTATTTGLGGNQAPEASNYTQQNYRCFFEMLGFLSTPSSQRVCTKPEIVRQDAAGNVIKVGERPRNILILPWPYTFPGDIIPTIYVSALYTTPGNGEAWQAATFYPAGSVVQCPGESLCSVTAVTGTSRSGAADHEPNWATTNGMFDGAMAWLPIATVDYRLKDPHKAHLDDAPDGKPVYQVGDTVVWTPASGQGQIEATVVEWKATTVFTPNSVVICPQPGATAYPLHDERLCAAVTGGTSGTLPPQSWVNGVTDHDLTWSVDGQSSDQSHALQPGDEVFWNSSQGPTASIVQPWQGQTSYLSDKSVVLCPSGLPAPNNFKLCAATASGTSGPNPPTWASGSVTDGTVKWQYDVPFWLQRWKPDTVYQVKDAVRCEPAAQKANLCVATVGGYSGQVEPWWTKSSSTPTGAGSPAGAAAAAASPASGTPQRDNQVLWGQFTPSSGTPSADQVANLSAQELTQVHAPDLWGLSTAILYTTKRIPNSYSFMHSVSSGCPTYTAAVPATKTTSAVPAMTTDCPGVYASYQRATDIALMVSPYVFHHIYSKFNDSADGIDTETKWSATQPQDWIPEPIAGFGLNSVGNSFYVGLSLEVLVRNLQLVGGYGWIKAPNLTSPISASGTNTVTPNTYTAFHKAPFIGLAFNIAGLISGH